MITELEWYVSLAEGDQTRWGKWCHDLTYGVLICVAPVGCSTAPACGRWQRRGFITDRWLWRCEYGVPTAA